VEDSGKGINKELRKKLFENTTYPAPQNSVGLITISKGLIELMNGSISYKSKVNKGTRFTVTLPLPLYDEVTYTKIPLKLQPTF
jgi:signal transduction histidine kinase